MASRLLASAAACLAVALSFAGCSLDWTAPPQQPGAGGGATTSNGTMGTTSSTSTAGGSGTGGAGVGGGTGGAPSTDCGTSPPQAGTDCDTQVSACWYGDDVRPECRLQMDCQFGTWTVDWSCNCPPADSPQCPDDASGTPPACTLGSTLLCQFADGTHCGCAGTSWICPPTPPGCPTPAPNPGQPCSDPGQFCQYGSCALSTEMFVWCEDGFWETEDRDCNNPVLACD